MGDSAIEAIKKMLGVTATPTRIPNQLLHGTDRKTLLWSEEERASFHDSCLRVINHLSGFYKGVISLSTKLEESGLPKERTREVVNATSRISLVADRKPLYQYGDLYLTSTLMTAWGYANNAYGGGELGTTAYNLIIGAEALKEECWESDGLLKEDVARIKETALIAPAPVILIFITEGLDLQGLKSLSGGNITEESIHGGLFRYIKPVDFSKDPYVKNLPVGIDPYNTDPDELYDMANGKEQ